MLRNFTSIIIKKWRKETFIYYEQVNGNKRHIFTSTIVQNFSFEKKLEFHVNFHKSILVLFLFMIGNLKNERLLNF